MEVLSTQATAKFPTELVVANTPAVKINGEFPLGAPGTKFIIPSWNRIGDFADFAEDSEMDLGRITTHHEQATVVRGALGVGILDSAVMVSASSPMEEVSSQIARKAAEYVDGKLVLEALKSPNTFNQFNGTEQTVNTGICDQNTFAKALITKLGDQYGKVLAGGVVVVHSKVYADLVATGTVQKLNESGSSVMLTGILGSINGLRIIVSNRVTTSTISASTAYKSFILGPASLGLFYQRELFVEMERKPTFKKTNFACDVNFAPHLYGYDDGTTAVVAQDNQSIQVVVVTSK